MMHRLYLHIYLTVVASLALFVLVAGLMWRQLADVSPQSQVLEIVAALVHAALPAAAEPRTAQQAALERLNARVHADLALFARDGSMLAAAGAPLQLPKRSGSGWSGGPTWCRIAAAHGSAGQQR